MKFLKFDKESQLKTWVAVLESQVEFGKKRYVRLQKINAELHGYVNQLVNSKNISN